MSFPGHQMIDLSQTWSCLAPTWPYFPSSKQWNFHSHHKDGVQSIIIETNMHSGTHVDAPLHFSSWGSDIAQIPLERLVGSTVIVNLEHLSSDYSFFTKKDILDALPCPLEKGDNLIVYTGWHKYNWELQRDDERYFCKCPGPSLDVTEYLVEMGVNWVGGDLPSFEHPMALAIRGYRPDLAKECARKYGYENIEDFMPEEQWMLKCHRTMMKNEQMHVDNIGGDIRRLKDYKKKFTCGIFPWKWQTGDASIARLVAFLPENESI